MRRQGKGPRRYLEDFPVVVDMDVMRKAAGGRPRLRRTDSMIVTLDGGTDVRIEILHHPWRWGSTRPFVKCPYCDRRVNTLRRINDFPYLACGEDIRQLHHVKYRSQVLSQRAATAAPYPSSGASAP